MSKQLWYISKYTILPNLGNPTRQFFLAKYLQREGFDVSLISSRSALLNRHPSITGNYVKYELEGFKQFVLNGPKVRLGLTLKRILSWIIFEYQVWKWSRKNAESPDIVIVSSLSILTFITGIYLKRRYKCKLVVEVRDIYPFTLIEIGGFSRYNPLICLLGLIERKAYQNADWIIGTLPKLDVHIKQISPGAELKFKHIPIGIDTEYFKDFDRSNVVETNLPKDKFVVGYFGSFGKTQATDIIFKAIVELSENQFIHFFMAGEGPEKESGMRQIRGLSNHTILDGIPKKLVQEMINRCDLVLNPWLSSPVYDFGISPNKWIDYMWSAKPILIAFDGYQKIIDDANCGVVVPAEDLEGFVKAIRDLSECSKEKLREMGENGRTYLLNHLTYATHANNLKKLIQEK